LLFGNIMKQINLPAIHIVCCLVTLSLALMTSMSQAMDKALLIGVSDYHDDRISDLPGISLDLDMMKLTAQRLGFTKKNIRMLVNDDSNHHRIKEEMTGWLTQNVTPNDRVLIYYSGHGSRIPDKNGDEADDMDEVLVTSDAKIAPVPGENYNTLKNVIVDDDLYNWLAKIPSQQIFFFVDACNSGTANKGLDLSGLPLGEVSLGHSSSSGQTGNKSLNLKTNAVTKFLSYPKMINVRLRETHGLGNDDSRKLNHVMFLSAAKDTEFALATEKGSVFTLGLDSIIEKAFINKQVLTSEQLHQQITKFVEDKITSDKLQGNIHHPQLNIGQQLKNKNLFTITDNSNQQSAQDIAKYDFEQRLKQGHALVIRKKRSRIKLGDVIQFTIDIPQDGWYLNIIHIGSNGERYVLFPNKLEDNNQMKKGLMAIPGKKMPFDIRASKPVGTSYVYAFLTREALNFYQDSIDGFDKEGKRNAFLSGLSAQAARSLTISSRYYAGKTSIHVD